MAYVYIEDEVDIDVQDFFESMSDKEVKKMLELICEDLDLKNPLQPNKKPGSVFEDEITEACFKITSKYFTLNKEDIDTIVNISKKV